MARAYKVSSDHPSVDYLVRSRADLGGRIKSNLKEAKDLARCHPARLIKIGSRVNDSRNPAHIENKELAAIC